MRQGSDGSVSATASSSLLDAAASSADDTESATASFSLLDADVTEI